MSRPRTRHLSNVPRLRGEKHDISPKILHQAGFETTRFSIPYVWKRIRAIFLRSCTYTMLPCTYTMLTCTYTMLPCTYMMQPYVRARYYPVRTRYYHVGLRTRCYHVCTRYYHVRTRYYHVRRPTRFHHVHVERDVAQ